MIWRVQLLRLWCHVLCAVVNARVDGPLGRTSCNIDSLYSEILSQVVLYVIVIAHGGVKTMWGSEDETRRN